MIRTLSSDLPIPGSGSLRNIYKSGTRVLIHLLVLVCSGADTDPGSGAFLTPGSGMGKKSGSGSGMNNPDLISESLETMALG
jgi:hypothetical protein